MIDPYAQGVLAAMYFAGAAFVLGGAASCMMMSVQGWVQAHPRGRPIFLMYVAMGAMGIGIMALASHQLDGAPLGPGGVQTLGAAVSLATVLAVLAAVLTCSVAYLWDTIRVSLEGAKK